MCGKLFSKIYPKIDLRVNHFLIIFVAAKCFPFPPLRQICLVNLVSQLKYVNWMLLTNRPPLSRKLCIYIQQKKICYCFEKTSQKILKSTLFSLYRQVGQEWNLIIVATFITAGS